MLTTTTPFLPTAWRARRTRLKCPACKQPIVGAKPIRVPAHFQRKASFCMATAAETIRMILFNQNHPEFTKEKTALEFSNAVGSAIRGRRRFQRRPQTVPTNSSADKIQRRTGGHFMSTGLVGRRVRFAVVGRHDFVR